MSKQPKKNSRTASKSALQAGSTGASMLENDDDVAPNPHAAPSRGSQLVRRSGVSPLAATPPSKKQRICCVGCDCAAAPDGSNWYSTAVDDRGKTVPQFNLCINDGEFTAVLCLTEDELVSHLSSTKANKESYSKNKKEYFANKAHPDQREFEPSEIVEEFRQESVMKEWQTYITLLYLAHIVRMHVFCIWLHVDSAFRGVRNSRWPCTAVRDSFSCCLFQLNGGQRCGVTMDACSAAHRGSCVMIVLLCRCCNP
jgi:hypothetical protein